MEKQKKQLDFRKTREILKKSNLKIEGDISKNINESLKISKKIRFPLVLKIVSKNILHKTDAGCVKVCNNEDEIKKNYNEIIRNAKKIKNAKIDGILMQKFEKGTEIIIGMKRDKQFDASIMFGIGGIFVEVYNDVSFRVAPVDKRNALEMIQEIKGYKLLAGARGMKKLNIDAVANIIVNLSKLSLRNKNIAEIDLNPVIVDEKSAKIVDARVISDE